MYQQSWPQIAARLKSVDPEIQVDPAKPIPMEALPMVQRGVQTQASYIQREAERRAAEKAAIELPGIKADAEKKQIELENEKKFGATSGAQADAKYRFLQAQKSMGKPWSADDTAFVKGYEKQKLLVPATTAQIRIEGMGQSRQYQVYDNKNHSAKMASSDEINRAEKEEPGRYTLPGYTPEAIGTKEVTKAFTTGKPAEELVAFNTAIAHADLLKQAAVALKNGDLKVLNSIKNKYKEQTGSDLPTNYKVIAGAYSRELNKALSAGHVTDTEIKEAGATIPSDASLEQILGATDAYKALMQSKVQQRKAQYEAGKTGQPNFGGNPQSAAAPPQGATHAVKNAQGEIIGYTADGKTMIPVKK
jgi:hypothetical protein